MNLLQHPFLLLMLACAGLFLLPIGLVPSDQPVWVRVAGALVGLCCVGLTQRIGLLWKSELVGILAASILASSFGFFALTQTPGPSLFILLGATLALDVSLRILLGHGQNKTRRAMLVYGVAFITLVIVRNVWTTPERSFFPDLSWSLMLGFLPWLVFLPRVAQRWSTENGFALRRDAGAAFLIGTSFLGLGLGWPALVPLAVLVAAAWEEDWGAHPMPDWVSTGIVSLNLLVMAAIVALKWPSLEMSPFRSHAALLGLTLCVAMIIQVGVWGMRRTVAAFGGILLAAVLLLGSLMTLSTYLNAADPSVNLLPPSGTPAEPAGPIDPESPVEFATVPVLPPPAQVRLADTVIRKDQWKGPRSAVTQNRRAIFRQADRWEKFWKEGLSPYSPRLAQAPAVDFQKDMVIGVFLGEKPDPHFDTEIVSIRSEKLADGTAVLRVRYREWERMRGVFSPPFAVQPFHLRRVPVFAGPIVFEKVQR